MPKNKFQDVIFTILMAAVMVYGMVCYNISLETGGLRDAVFAMALIWQFFFAGPLVRRIFGLLFREKQAD
ncbi:hypothetical protein [Agathobaculum sp.]|uniref:hypothetical protein n=1 Tax=Agathobaculum sp. TaxID=2048138 RepID=UPI0027BAF926|nr:hypothetical protein [Agathobaculum sp.]